MSQKTTRNDLGELLRHVIAFAGWRALLLVALMIAAALSEGVGLLLVVPLLAFTGTVAPEGPASPITTVIADLAASLGVTLSFEIVLVAFLVLVILRQVVVFWNARLSADIRIDYVAAIRKELFASLGETSWRFLSGRRLDVLGQILLIDSWRVGEAALHVTRIASGLVLLVANVAVAIIVAPLLAISVLGGITLLTLLFSNRLYRVQATGREISHVQNNIYRVVENYLGNIRVAKVAGATDRMQHDFSVALDSLSARLSGFVGDTEAIKMSLQVFGAIGIAVVLIVAVNVLDAAGLELLLLILITARFIPRVSMLNQDLHRLLYDLPAFTHAKNVLRDCRQHPDIETSNKHIPRMRESIAVRGVTVIADDEQGKRILDNVSLEVAVREIVAIVGPSGAGKSTLVDVVAGLLLPDAGEIIIDGRAIGLQAIGAWRRRVGYVPQTATLLQDTIGFNLRWVLPQPASQADLDTALQCATLDAVIADLPDGLDTIVDRREGRLSGGERQRVAIARELLRSPDLLILDEATNALDVATECRLLKNLRDYYPELTILIVAHRPTAIALADRVVTLGNETDA